MTAVNEDRVIGQLTLDEEAEWNLAHGLTAECDGCGQPIKGDGRTVCSYVCWRNSREYVHWQAAVNKRCHHWPRDCDCDTIAAEADLS